MPHKIQTNARPNRQIAFLQRGHQASGGISIRQTAHAGRGQAGADKLNELLDALKRL